MITMLVQAASVPAVPSNIPEPDAASMTGAEVKAFNATVGADHPYRIRCRTIAITGSLSKRGRACRTLSQWQRLDQDGQEHARAIVEHSQTRMSGQ
jgi:hypothetical protein